jgi:hypothetical protein
LVAALAAGTAVAAPQILPYLEYYRESSSALSTAALERWASHLSPVTLAHFFMPFLGGSPVSGFEHLARALHLGPMDNFNERTGYVGVFALFLAATAIVRVRSRIVVFHAVLVTVSLLVVYGVPPWPTLARAIPVVNAVNHQRLLLVVGFGLAVLAGLGLHALLATAPARRGRNVAIGFVAALAGVGLVIWRMTASFVTPLTTADRAFLLGQLWIPVVGAAIALIVTHRAPGRRFIAVACVGWTAIDLLWFGMGLNPAIPRDRYYPETEGIRLLQRDRAEGRLLGISLVLPTNTAAVFGLDDVRGQDFMSLRRYEELVTGRAGDFGFLQGLDRFPPSLALLNVRHVVVPRPVPADPAEFTLVHDGDMAIYRAASTVDRSLVVFDYEVHAAPGALARVRSGNFDPRRTVVLEEAPIPIPQGEAGDPSGIADPAARIEHYDTQRVVIDARLPRPGVGVMQDNDYPGWQARVNGRRVPLLRANYAFRAVQAPAGISTVTFEYVPWSFYSGIGIAAVAVLVLALAWTADRRRRRTQLEGGPAPSDSQRSPCGTTAARPPPAPSQLQTSAIQSRLDPRRCAICIASGASIASVRTPMPACPITSSVTVVRRRSAPGVRNTGSRRVSQRTTTAVAVARSGCHIRSRISRCDVGSRSAAKPSASEACGNSVSPSATTAPEAATTSSSASTAARPADRRSAGTPSGRPAHQMVPVIAPIRSMVLTRCPPT